MPVAVSTFSSIKKHALAAMGGQLYWSTALMRQGRSNQNPEAL